MNKNQLIRVTRLFKIVGKKIVDWKKNAKRKKILIKKTFKTDADFRANKILTNGLRKIFPRIPIISEESAQHRPKRPSKYWLIDPIDGTSSWRAGFNGFVTQGAVIHNGIPIFGIIHAPMLKKTWTSKKNSGATLNGKKISKSKLINRLIIADNSPKPHGIAKKLSKSLRATGYLESGSIGLKAVYVADGTADLFVKDVKVRDWDLAPASVILQEVGSCLRTGFGRPFIFQGPFTKTNGLIVARDKGLLAKAVKEFKKAKRIS